jgi:hypothetical protein
VEADNNVRRWGLIISGRLKMVFVHIPKTAGDAITSALRPYLGWSDVVVVNDVQAWTRRIVRRGGSDLYGLGKHATAEEIRRSLDCEKWDEYSKFAVVRHPVTRAVSLYKYMARMADERKEARLRNLWYATPLGSGAGDPAVWPAMRAYRETDSFAEFIRHPAVREDLAMLGQTRFVCNEDGELIVDFVGRFERLESDVGLMLSRLGVYGATLRTKNVSGGTRRSVQVNGEDKEYLGEMFRRDFVMFDYE